MGHSQMPYLPEAATLAVSTLALLIASAASAQTPTERIRVSPDSPWYWSYGGETVLLLGGSDEDNLFNDPDLMMANLDALAACGGNYIRGTLSCRDEGNVWPFERVGGKYDLSRFNPEFWERLDRCCRECRKRDIIMQIEVWATWDFYADLWPLNAWNPALGVSYTTENTELAEAWPHLPWRRVQPFFHSPPALSDDTVLRSFQEAFVRKLLDVTLPYPNVLYCFDNETRAPAEWPWYWARFVKEEAKRRGAEVQLTEMWDLWDIRTKEHAPTYEHPELFSFTDVSQNNWNDGQLHYDRLIWFRENLKQQPGGPRPMNNVKVYQRQSRGRPGSAALCIDRWWQNVWAGCASTRFHRPTGGIGLSDEAQAVIKAARTFTDAFDIFTCEPRPDLLSDREDNEAYCLARPAEVYALYFPKGGQVTLDVSREGKGLTLRWFDPTDAQFQASQPLPDGRRVSLQSPDTNHTWLALISARGAK